jgi:hypothetical protein
MAAGQWRAERANSLMVAALFRKIARKRARQAVPPARLN